METFTNRYKKPSSNSKDYLLKKYFNMKMDKDVSVSSYINEVAILIDRFKSVKIEFIDEVRVTQLLMPFHNSWETMKMIVSNSVGGNTLKFSRVCDLAIIEKIHRKSTSKEFVVGLALIINKGKNKKYFENDGLSNNKKK